MKMIKNGVKISAAVLAVSLLLAGCNGNVEVTTDNQSSAQQSSSNISSTDENTSSTPEESNSSSGDDKNEGVKFVYHFADKEEGISLKMAHTVFYDSLNQNDMDYRVQKKGATLEELKEFAKEQILEFTEAEKEAIGQSLSTIESIMNEKGYKLPPMTEITFIKTTQLEEGGALAYTHAFEIYVGETFTRALMSGNEGVVAQVNAVMCHEIFHCLTRNNPDFRKNMYSFINFTVQDKDFELGPDTKEMFYTNPDVDHRNAYATFKIKGEDKDCFILFITKPFEKEGDDFISRSMTCLVPVDDTNTYYVVGEDISLDDFYAVVGANTGYTIDPEECMADNFGDAIIYGKDGKTYKSPEIIDAIIDYLKK